MSSNDSSVSSETTSSGRRSSERDTHLAIAEASRIGVPLVVDLGQASRIAKAQTSFLDVTQRMNGSCRDCFIAYATEYIVFGQTTDIELELYFSHRLVYTISRGLAIRRPPSSCESRCICREITEISLSAPTSSTNTCGPTDCLSVWPPRPNSEAREAHRLTTPALLHQSSR